MTTTTTTGERQSEGEGEGEGESDPPSPRAQQQQQAAVATAALQKWGDGGAEIRTFNDAFRIGTMFARSGYFRDAIDANQAMVKMQAGAELGFSPMASMLNVFIIEGKPGYGASMILARIIREGGRYKILTQTAKRATECEIEWSRKWPGDEQATVLGTTRFSIEEAKQADLLDKKGPHGGKNTWQKYPKNMLFARCVSAGAREWFPDLFLGAVYDVDELRDEMPIRDINEPPPRETGSVETAPKKAKGRGRSGSDALAQKASEHATMTATPPVTSDVLDGELIEGEQRDEQGESEQGDEGAPAPDSAVDAGPAPTVETAKGPDKPTVTEPPKEGATLAQAIAAIPGDATGITKHFSKWNAQLPLDEQPVLQWACRRAFNLASGKPEWAQIPDDMRPLVQKHLPSSTEGEKK
jgi:hypothetical protein